MLRSVRHGLPVTVRVSTASSEPASNIFALISGVTSLSTVFSQTEPHQTPSQPSASAAAICRPRPTPPAPSTGRGATASTMRGQSTIEVVAAGVAAGLGADGDDEVAADVLVPQRVLGRARHRRDLDALRVRPLDQLARRRAERVDDQLDRMLERDVDHPRALLPA